MKAKKHVTGLAMVFMGAVLAVSVSGCVVQPMDESEAESIGQATDAVYDHLIQTDDLDEPEEPEGGTKGRSPVQGGKSQDNSTGGDYDERKDPIAEPDPEPWRTIKPETDSGNRDGSS